MEEQMIKNQKIYTLSIILLLTISLAYAIGLNSIFEFIRLYKYCIINGNMFY